MLKKIFQQNRQRGQVIGASVGAFLGLYLLLFALQTYFDIQKILRGGSEGSNYISINKPVSLVNTFLGSSVFRAEEIKDIENQSFIESVGVFSSNRFKATASSRMIQFYTELFFESIPISFLDVRDPDFRWSEGQGEIPIIVSKDYLALYNFGFALSHGLPQFTPSTIKQFAVDVTLNGNGRQETFRGRIIGFSERIHSILVPESFLTWANTQFGDHADLGPARLMLKVKNVDDKRLQDFLQEKGYELSNSRLASSKAQVLLTSILSVLAIIGVLLTLLSVLVFMLNYQLLISKSNADIKLLLQIGYKPSSIIAILRGSLLRLLAFIFIAVVLALIGSRFFVVHYLAQQGLTLPHLYHPVVLITGVLLFILIIYVNVKTIQKHIMDKG